MKTKLRYWIVMIMVTIAFSDDQEFELLIRRATCSLKCSDEQCEKTCKQSESEIYVHDVEANANATLVCRDVEFIVLAHNPGGTFIIERRSRDDADWSDAIISNFYRNETKVTLYYLMKKTSYQFRFHRIFEDGISSPEITDWFETMSGTWGPLSIPYISEPKFQLESSNPLLVRSEMSFTPAKDRTCFYEAVCWAPNNRNIPINLDKPTEFNMTFNELEFDTEYLVTIMAHTMKGMSSHRSKMTFTTPTCLDLHKNLTICPPGLIKGLDATAIHKWGNTFDVNVTWNMPELIPDYYNVQLYPIIAADTELPITKNISGAITQTIFSEVILVEQYDVHIGAVSSGGQGLIIFKRFNIPLKNYTSNPSGTLISPNVGTIVLTFLASVVLAVGTGIYVYHRHERRKRSQKRIKYFESLEAKEVPLNIIENAEEPDLITSERLLLVPEDEYEISPDRLKIKRVLGSGAFGIVKLGSLRDDRGHVTDVAVKMLRDDPNEEDIRSFELEIKMMKSAGQHPNIVSLIGCCTVGPQLRLIVEYCSRGDLQSFLRGILEKATVSVIEPCPNLLQNRETSNDHSDGSCSASLDDQDDVHVCSFVANRAYDIDREAFQDTDMLTVTDLLNFGRQIATGMEFLSSIRVVHRDLAARNVLVCNDRTVKISDFGLSRDIYQENVYKKQGNGRVPVKWMAIEALTHQVYSTYSDVWSFGILLWEIVTLGSSPYPDIPANGVLKRLRLGYRMERPPNCSVALYNVMLSCWQTKPRDRPTFTILRQELDKLICVAAEHKYLDLNDSSKGVPFNDEDSQTPNSRYTYLPLQLRYTNEHQLRVIHEDQK